MLGNIAKIEPNAQCGAVKERSLFTAVFLKVEFLGSEWVLKYGWSHGEAAGPIFPFIASGRAVASSTNRVIPCDFSGWPLKGPVVSTGPWIPEPHVRSLSPT